MRYKDKRPNYLCLGWLVVVVLTAGHPVRLVAGAGGGVEDLALGAALLARLHAWQKPSVSEEEARCMQVHILLIIN